MKRIIFNRVTSFIETVYRQVMIYMSFTIICIYGIGFIYQIINDPASFEHFKQLIGSAGGTATLAGLSFYAGYMTPHHHKKPAFYNNGEMLYHATILFSVSALIFNCILIFKSAGFAPEIIAFISILLTLLTIGFFIYGLILTNLAVVRLLLALHADYRKLLQDNLPS